MSAPPPFEVLRAVPTEVVAEATKAARSSRLMRGLALRNARALNEEGESLRRAVAALYEYCVVNRVAINFKRLTADCSDEDVIEDENSDDAVAEGFRKFWYTLSVEMRINKLSHNGALKSCGQLSGDLEVEVKRALDTMKPARTVVSLDHIKASYSPKPDEEFYTITAVLHTPPDFEPTHRSPTNKRFAKLVAFNNSKRGSEKRKLPEAEAPPPAIAVTQPSVEECVDFYSKNTNTWKFLGAAEVTELIFEDGDEGGGGGNKRVRRY